MKHVLALPVLLLGALVSHAADQAPLNAVPSVLGVPAQWLEKAQRHGLPAKPVEDEPRPSDPGARKEGKR